VHTSSGTLAVSLICIKYKFFHLRRRCTRFAPDKLAQATGEVSLAMVCLAFVAGMPSLARSKWQNLTCVPEPLRLGRALRAQKPQPRPTMCADPPQASDIAETTMQQEDGALDVDGEAVVVKPDQRLAAAFTFIGGFLVYNGTSWTVVGVPLLVFGAFLYLQTARVRFVFGPSKLNVASRDLRSGDLNFIRGWAYEEFAAWDIYPSPYFPVLAYFRERESYGGRGSIHFFPILADGKQLRELLETRTGRPRG
jgi:Protein of unknown function (DUF3119)